MTTPEERLAKLEVLQREMRDDIADIKKDVRALDRMQVRMGGFLFAFACLGAFVTWLLSSAKSLFGILPS